MMSLYKYELTFSGLTQSEKSELIERIDNLSWNGLVWNSDSTKAEFFIDEHDDLSSFKIPDSCHLTRIYQ